MNAGTARLDFMESDPRNEFRKAILKETDRKYPQGSRKLDREETRT